MPEAFIFYNLTNRCMIMDVFVCDTHLQLRDVKPPYERMCHILDEAAGNCWSNEPSQSEASQVFAIHAAQFSFKSGQIILCCHYLHYSAAVQCHITSSRECCSSFNSHGGHCAPTISETSSIVTHRHRSVVMGNLFPN